MGLYEKYVLPRIIHLACSAEPAGRQRAKLVPRATGRVLEIGIGSGLNLQFYDPAVVREVRGLDPSREMLAMASEAAGNTPFDVELLQAGAESIPLDTGSVDTVLLTYTLCSIGEAGPALQEMVRVLEPEGQLLFCEHGAAPDRWVRRWQDWVNPLWRRVGGGCHLNRDIPALIRGGGFEITDMETMYIPGWRPASFNYWGRAEPSPKDRRPNA